MSASIRPYDAIGRYGGEEFLIVLPGCDVAVTEKQAERMRAALANDPMWFNEEAQLITCSFGATAWMPGITVTEEALIRVADDALYAAKRQGRNRVVFLPYTGAAMEAVPVGQQNSGIK
jgi:two-component system, cell cycle response regulator